MSISSGLKIPSKWKSCKYDVSVEIKFADGTLRQLQKAQIAGLYIEKDYDNDHHPILLLDLALSRVDENALDSKCEFHIMMKQYYLEEENGEKKDPRIFLNDTFVKLDFGTTPNTSSKMDKEIRESSGLKDGDVAPQDLASQSTFPLVKKDDLILTKNVVNGNLADVTQHDIFFWMLSNAGCKKPIVISNFMNPEKIPEIVIHPRGLLKSLLFMEKEYGWHQEGTYIFFDYDKLYVTRMNGVCTAWAPNEQKEICFCISESTSSDNIPSGVAVTNTTIYYNIGVDQYSMSNGSVVSDQIEGNNMLLTNTQDGGSKNMQANVESYGTSGSYNVKSHHGHNPYVSEQHNRRKLEQENQLKMTCTNGDISFLCPNKQISVLTDVSSIADRFRGNYRLASFKTSLIKNGDYFDSTTEVIVKRVSK